MAGSIRTAKGREMYCNILSIIETIKRRKMNIIENILKIFQGNQLYFSWVKGSYITFMYSLT